MKNQEPSHNSIEYKFSDSISTAIVSDETDSSMMQEDCNDARRLDGQPVCNYDGKAEEELLSSSEIESNVGDEEHSYLPKMNASQSDQNEKIMDYNDEELDHRQEASVEISSTSSLSRIRHWIIPLSIVAFIGFCLISNVIRPHEEKIERRSRPLHLRPVLENLPLPSFPKFSIRELFYDERVSVNGRSRDLDYYQKEDYYQKDGDDYVEEEKNDDQGNDDGENATYYDNYYNATSNQTYYYDDDYESK